MRIDKKFWMVFGGALWEWGIIPVTFFILLPKGKNFYYIFPSDFLRFLIGTLFFIPAFYITIFSCSHLHRKGEGTIMPQRPLKNLYVKEFITIHEIPCIWDTPFYMLLFHFS